MTYLTEGLLKFSHYSFDLNLFSADSYNFGTHVPKDDIPLSIQWLFQRCDDASVMELNSKVNY